MSRFEDVAPHRFLPLQPGLRSRDFMSVQSPIEGLKRNISRSPPVVPFYRFFFGGGFPY